MSRASERLKLCLSAPGKAYPNDDNDEGKAWELLEVDIAAVLEEREALLEALKALMGEFDHDLRISLVEASKAAIARAEGGEP